MIGINVLFSNEGGKIKLYMRFGDDTKAALINITAWASNIHTIIFHCLHCMFIIVNVMVHYYRSGNFLNNGLHMCYLICLLDIVFNMTWYTKWMKKLMFPANSVHNIFYGNYTAYKLSIDIFILMV